MARKLLLEEVRGEFAKRGWQLTSNEYKGSQKPLNAICSAGHQTTITWNNLQRGQGCRYCAGNIKLTMNQVKEEFSQNGCELLDSNYENNNKPLKSSLIVKVKRSFLLPSKMIGSGKQTVIVI